MQHEITEAIPLLDGKGDLTQPGYAKKLLPVYERAKVKGGATRLKEWDYYLVMCGQFALALTVADNSYMGLDSISFLSFQDRPWEITKSPMRPFPMGRTGLPASSAAGTTASAGKFHALCFNVADGKRTLMAHMERFRGGDALDAVITLSQEPEESMVICTPFDKPGHFYYNQKILCMRAAGTVSIGSERFEFSPERSFGLLDWGRGVWTYSNTWYWGAACGEVDGVPFGFNLGYGFGDTTAATENMLLYGGKVHKLSNVTFEIPMKNGREDYLMPWRFTSDDRRFEMSFVPILDRSACTDVKLIKSDQHQVFGRFSGKAVLDNGKIIEIKDFLGFAEKVVNKW